MDLRRSVTPKKKIKINEKREQNFLFYMEGLLER